MGSRCCDQSAPCLALPQSPGANLIGRYDVAMLEFLRFLSDLGTLRSMPWRSWLSFALGCGGIILILMHVKTGIAVVYIFFTLILSVVLGSAWEWHVEARANKHGRGNRKGRGMKNGDGRK